MVANGDRVYSFGCCKKVTLTLQGMFITIDFYLLSFQGCEMVLGAHWLRTLGPILLDFPNFRWNSQQGGKEYQLQGETVSKPFVIRSSMLRKVVKGKWMLLQICTIQETPIEHSFDPQIEKLRLQYSDVFVEPTKLSPPRSHDHWKGQTQFHWDHICAHITEKMKL